MALRDSSVAACVSFALHFPDWRACDDEKKSIGYDVDANNPYEGLICRLFCDMRNGNEVGPLMPVIGVGGLVE